MDLNFAGSQSLESAFARFAMQRTATTYGDTDGDGSTNIAVRRPELVQQHGRWFERRLAAAGLQFESVEGAFGGVTSGDFFGTGRSALSFFSDGRWLSQRADGSQFEQLWGIAGDQAVPEDFNGDGVSDYAVFRPAEGSWWMLSKGRAQTPDIASVSYWGGLEDIPVPADYDGDGNADIAIWRPQTGQWFIRYLDGSVQTIQLGAPGDIPMPGNYTGDGRVEPAVWRPYLGLWIIKRGETAADILVEPWGLPSDVPVQGDFDGDGRSDLAVWRKSTGTWYIRKADNLDVETKVIQFGLPGDTPLGAPPLSALF
jgi:hypothetical protein